MYLLERLNSKRQSCPKRHTHTDSNLNAHVLTLYARIKRIQISSTDARGPYAIDEALPLNRGNGYRNISQKWTRLLFIANLDRGSYDDRSNGHRQYPIQIRTGCRCRGTASSFLAKVIQCCCLINLFHGKTSQSLRGPFIPKFFNREYIN